jgi:hypothetical protein
MTDPKDTTQCCDPKEHIAMTECCCCGPGTTRHFYTAKEKIERLESYRETLESELAGVKEAIKEFKTK